MLINIWDGYTDLRQNQIKIEHKILSSRVYRYAQVKQVNKSAKNLWIEHVIDKNINNGGLYSVEAIELMLK